jgi:hypothetical protein
VEDALSCVEPKKQGLRKELTEKIVEIQDLQATRTFVNTPTKRLVETVTDTREHFHDDLGLMIHDETQITKILIVTTWREFEDKIAEDLTRAERRKGTISGLAWRSHWSTTALNHGPYSGTSASL